MARILNLSMPARFSGSLTTPFSLRYGAGFGRCFGRNRQVQIVGHDFSFDRYGGLTNLNFKRDCGDDQYMNLQDIIQNFQHGLSSVQVQIEQILKDHNEKAVPVISLDFPNLPKLFPSDLLEKAKVVTVSGKLPFPVMPPELRQMGLPDFGQMANASNSAVTYKDTFFVNSLHRDESIYFHELVHVVQWERLGVENFLLAYGVGLMQFGYQDSPLEQMAYFLQEDFEKDRLPDGVVELIRQRTDDVWADVASLIFGGLIPNGNI
jgi:hypothetical protein